MQTYYITTPLYYASGMPHIGTAYCSIAADVMARYKKLRGYDVKFLTGNDEFGQKNEDAALAKKMDTQKYLDETAIVFQDMAKTVDVEVDIFWRTTDPKHQKAVQKIFKTLYDNGDIYKGAYEGWYCTPCESFFTEYQLKDGTCPDCNRAVQQMKEEAYFFKLSKYQDKLLAHIESHPEFIMPESRKNEMINNFLKPGLADLCVSRTSFKWGIPVDFDPGHVVYVWVDALTNYANALGFMSDDDSDYKKYWPADVHMVGKEIVRFHTLIWPAILLALGEPLPKQVYGHGWLTSEGKKVSKSLGNAIDPHLLVTRYGSDAIRYFLMREFVFGQDGDFKNEAMLTRINADLANDLGNLLSRTVGMIEKYFGGTLPNFEDFANAEIFPQPQNPPKGDFDDELQTLAAATSAKVEQFMDKMAFSDALKEIWQLISRANHYTDDMKPWIMCKEDSQKAALANVLYNLAETLRIVAIMIKPVMPRTPQNIFNQLAITENVDWESTKKFGLLPKSFTVVKQDVLFPRLDIKKELTELTANQKPAAKTEEIAEVSQLPEITIDDFAKVELKVGVVLECEQIEGTRLLKSQIKVGEQVKQIVSGIANFYTPQQMQGKKVIVVTNLKPVKLRGVLSEGMILAASNGKGKGENLSVVTVDLDIVDGSEVR